MSLKNLLCVENVKYKLYKCITPKELVRPPKPIPPRYAMCIGKSINHGVVQVVGLVVAVGWVARVVGRGRW